MKIGLTADSAILGPRVLNAAVEAATEVAQAELEAGKAPPLAQAIEQYGVRWEPEANPPGQESFDPPSIVIKRGTGDCDDLAPYWAAELRASQVDPDAAAEVYQSGPKRYHVVVRRGDGTVDDPSKWAGMGRRTVSGRIPQRTPLGDSRLVVGFQHAPRGLVRARLDVQPAVSGTCGVSADAIGYDTLDALERATRAAAVLAFWGAPDDVIARVLACNSAIRTPAVSGESWDEYIGAVQASIDPAAASNIAMTLLDPFGLRNLIAPAASSIMNQYAQQYAQPPKKVKVSVKTDDTTSGDWASYQASQKKGQRGGSGQRGGGQRGGGGRGDSGSRSSRSTQPTDQGYWDDYSGYVYDTSTGLWFDPNTGTVVDPSTGAPLVQPFAQNAAQPYMGPAYYGQFAQPYAQSAPQPSPYAYGQPYGYQPQPYSWGGGHGGYDQYGNYEPYG